MAVKKSLEGLRVLDLTRVLAGPYCTQMLGDLGADIIKIEKPGAGDDTRSWGPPFLKDKDGNDTEQSAYYLSVNRNKKSVAVDIKKTEGQKIILRLLEHCDVLIENFKTGDLKKYGLDYEALHAQFPRLIYCSITGFGQTGPLASEPGYDLMAQAMAGLMSVTGEPEGAPMKAGVALSDIITGLHAGIGILAALHARGVTGKGQHVDVALFDCTLASLTNLAQYYLTSGKVAPRFGNRHSTIVPYQALEVQDGHIVVAVGNDAQFKKFANMLGHSQWAQDARFITNAVRVQNRGALIPLIETVMKEKPAAHWIDLMRELDIPGGPVNGIDQAFAMEQTQARGMAIDLDGLKLVGSPLKLSDTPAGYALPPPVRGQDTRTVLAEVLGMDAPEIERLVGAGVVEG